MALQPPPPDPAKATAPSSDGPSMGEEAVPKPLSAPAAKMEALSGAATVPTATGSSPNREPGPISPAPAPQPKGPLAPPPPPPAAPTAPAAPAAQAVGMASPPSPRRRRPRPRAHVLQTAALAMFIAGSASYLAATQSSRAGLASKFHFPERLPQIQETLLHSIHNIPSLSRNLLQGPKSGKTFTVESAELAWEKSEDAFRQLRAYDPEQNRGRNYMGRMWEGLEELFRGFQRGGEKERSDGWRGDRSLRADHKDWVFAPLSTTLLAICALVVLMAKFVVNPSPDQMDRRSRLVLDDTEAEILDFYEKEMECDEIPFLHEFKEGHDVHPVRRMGSDGSLNRTRCASDLYYSRVLHDIETLNYEEEEGGEREGEINPMGIEEEEEAGEVEIEVDPAAMGEGVMEKGELEGECQITLLENVSSLTEEEASGGPENTVVIERLGSGDDTDLFQSAHSEVGGDAPARPQSPQESACSSISSLTSEGIYPDFEAPMGLLGSNDSLEMAHEAKAHSPLYSWDSPTSLRQSLTDSQEQQAATPPRSNVRKDPAPEPKLPRRVSFNPNVDVHEIPRDDDRQSSGLSPEGCLYVMLFCVAVAIVAFSLFPAHPSLSPIVSATRDEILRRTENILNSQWDVEL